MSSFRAAQYVEGPLTEEQTKRGVDHMILALGGVCERYRHHDPRWNWRYFDSLNADQKGMYRLGFSYGKTL